MLAARPVKVHQRLLQAMPRNIFQPRVVSLGLSELVGLRPVIHPRTTATEFTTLLQSGVPHRPAHRADLLGKFNLFVGELDPKTSTGQACLTDPSRLRVWITDIGARLTVATEYGFVNNAASRDFSHGNVLPRSRYDE